MDARDDKTIGRVLGEIAARVHRLNPWCAVEDLIGEGWAHVLSAYEGGFDAERGDLAPWVAIVAHHHLHWYARRWAPGRLYAKARTGDPKVLAWTASYDELVESARSDARKCAGNDLAAAELRDQPRWPDALIDDRAWYEAAYTALLAITGGDVAELDRLLDGRDKETREELRDLGTKARRLLSYIETTNPQRLRQCMVEDEDGG